jgi:hypothetical protein
MLIFPFSDTITLIAHTFVWSTLVWEKRRTVSTSILVTLIVMKTQNILITRLFVSPKSVGNISTATMEARDDSNVEIPTSNLLQNDANDRIECHDLISPMKRLLCRTTMDTDSDMSIGLRLALPDKVGIMRGLEVASVNRDIEFGCSPSLASKKLIIIPEPSIQSPLASFRRKSSGTPLEMNSIPEINFTDSVDRREELLIRTSELEPSVHQLVIPTATDLLIHARICSLLEGYDRLLESRTKARKRWFDFNSLVGMDR